MFGEVITHVISILTGLVITSYSIHYTKLYEITAGKFNDEVVWSFKP